MVIEKLREKARREAAEQEEAQLAKRRPRVRSKRRPRKPLIPHNLAGSKIFVRIFTIWGAAVAGFSVMALSSVTIARLSMFTGLGALGSLAQIVFALIAAAIGGTIGFIASNMFKSLVLRTAEGGPIAAMAARRVRPIDPASELGSDSLDAPIEEMPFSSSEQEEEGELEDYPLELEEPEPEAFELDASAALDDDVGPEGQIDATLASAPQAENDDHDTALELGEFEQIEDPAPAARPSVEQASSGIEKLRQSKPDDLSLVQLVERFAAALHDAHDNAPGGVAGSAEGDPQREKALAEALKALSLFTERGFGQPAAEELPGEASEANAKPSRFGSKFGGQAKGPSVSAISETENELRAALAKLQNLRGAA
ncbi:MAG: hypothetical protein AAFR64_10380 [Pseudomonadota bacterium]